VTTPQISSITDTYALIKVLCQARVDPCIGIAVNMSRSVNEAQQAFQKISLCAKRFLHQNIDYLGNIFYSIKISESLNRRTPVVNIYPSDLRSGRRIALLAQKILTRISLKAYQKEEAKAL